ncbi:MAG: glucuronate isomerase [Bacteroidota bacterium]|nr:glucuronate isomerase [Bacteroidota bacterium]
MKQFLDENFLLQNETARKLYHQYAVNMPVIDYHCHLSPAQIANNHRFRNLTDVWLSGDHYKWRAMRTNGIDEAYCTGKQSDWAKFEKWAETVPYTLRNPLYHWTHLELQRYFGIHEILNPATARSIYDQCTALLQTDEFTVKNLLRKMNVALVCTTDDPVDTLEFHTQLAEDGFEIPVLPAFRPDQAMNVASAENFNLYIRKLEAISGITVSSFDDFLYALQNRHDFFASMGCKVSDHGLEEIYAEDFTGSEIDAIFTKIHSGKQLNDTEQRKFRSAMLVHFAEWDWEKGWVQQFHLGALRNNNVRMLQQLGPDTGWDSIGDFSQARNLASFLTKLDSENKLAKTIVYNLNPSDNELMATMIGNYNDGSVAGKIQFGAAWWFLDQKDGMIKQMNALSNMGLLSRFVGMLTDSRSFLSFPRHEYFRRILCNLFGEEIENGEMPNDIEWVGKVVKDICYYNARNYFGWQDLLPDAG